MKLIKSRDDYKAGDLIFIKEYPGVVWTTEKSGSGTLWPLVGTPVRDLIEEHDFVFDDNIRAYNLGSFIKYMQQIAKVAEQSIDK